MWSHLPSLRQVHKEEKVKANSTISKPCHVFNIKGKGGGGLSIMQRKEPISEQTIIQSKDHILGPSTGVSQIPRDEAVEEGGNTNEEIDRFTSIPEDTPSPSSQAKARAPNCLHFLLGRVEEMHAMLVSHINYSMSQFTYLQGQITTLSS